jgi:hypothetical protein
LPEAQRTRICLAHLGTLEADATLGRRSRRQRRAGVGNQPACSQAVDRILEETATPNLFAWLYGAHSQIRKTWKTSLFALLTEFGQSKNVSS